MRRIRLNVRQVVLVALVVAWALFLRPTWLGGPATYVLIRGDSMQPTYDNGDFLVAYPQASYATGDIVAYRVPASEVGAGHLVVHRIDAVLPDGFELQGDNNPTRDPWIATSADLAGVVAVRIPGVGLALAFLLQPIVAGGLASSLVVMYAVARFSSTKPAKAARSVARESARARHSGT